MNCNYFKDNHREIEEKKSDFTYSLLFGNETIPLYSCTTGESSYEPTEEEMQTYCSGDFLHCPRLYLKLYKK